MPVRFRFPRWYGSNYTQKSIRNGHGIMKALLPLCFSLSLLSVFCQATGCGAQEAADFAKGIALRIEQKNRLAIEAFRNVLAASPNHAGALVQMGAALEDLGKWKEAENCYRRAIEIDPRNSSAKRNLNHLIATRGMNERANGPAPSQQALTERGLRALERRDFEKALRSFRLLRGLFPDNPHFVLYSAVAHERSGQREKAVAVYRGMAELYPNFSPTRVNLVVALLEAGDRKSAAREVRSALEAIPDDPRIRYLVRLLGTEISLSSEIGASDAPLSAGQP